MNKITNITKMSITFLLAMIFAAATMNLQAQSCNQVEILYKSPDCFEKRQGPVGSAGGGSCVEIAVCVNQPFTYSSSVTGTGWTFNWTVTGPTAVVINPNNTASTINIVWPQVGVFTLTLTATDGVSNVFTYCLKVNVKDKPVANFTFAPNNVCAGSTISFTNTTTYSGGGVAYSWDFGDPVSGTNNYSTTTSPVHTYNGPGVYTVTLVAYSFTSGGGNGTGADHPSITTCCADTIKKQVTIISGSLTIECISTVCSGDTATYTAVGCANPIWLPPVGGTILNQSGNTVTIIWGNGNPQGQILAQCPGGCIASVPIPIIPANPIIMGNANPCLNSTTSYSLPVLPGTFYTWTLTNISTATNYNILLNTYPDNNTVWINWALAPAGTYVLGINLTNNHICCSSNGSLTINPTQPWQAFFDQTVCTGPPGASLSVFPVAGTFNWTVLAPNTGVSPLTGTGSTFNPVFTNTGNYTVQVTETGNNYCNSGITNPQQIQITVVSTPVPGIINGPTTICTGTNYSYSMSTNAPTGYHYEWSISLGTGSFQPGSLTTTNGNSATILWTALPGTISVVLQRNGMPACPRPVTLNVVQATVGSISGPLNVCVDGTASYTLTGGNLPAGEIITWSLGAPFASIGTIISGQGLNSITILWHGQPGTGPWGPVTINASSGCGNAIPLPGVMIFPKFSFSISKTGTDICQTGVNLTVIGAPPGATYSWTLPGGPGPTTSFINNINIAGSYGVTVTKGGCSFTQQYVVEDPFVIAPVTCGVGTCSVNDSTNELLGVTIVKPLIGTFTYQWYRDTFPTGTLISGATTPNYLTPTYGNFYVIVTYGSCSKHVSFKVGKVCCPDVNIPKITSVVRNTCNSYTFTGTTLNPFGAPITWYWGDGTQDSGTSGVPITHVYTLAGEYCVTFCVGPPSSNTTNCSGNCVATNVTVPIDAAFTYTLGCNGCLSVSDASTVITTNPTFVTYFWNFGDGNTSTAQNPGLHCYNLPGTDTVTLTLTYNDGVVTCTKTATHIITYTPLGIIVSPTPVCSGTPSTYSSTPGSYVSYNWDFGDGFNAFSASSTHIYNSPGAFLVTLTVVDQLGNSCTDTTTISVFPGIGPCSIQPAFMCPGGSALLSTPYITGYTYFWEQESSPNVFIPAPGVDTNNTYTVTTPGFYRVIITDVNGCNCITKKVEVKAVPSPKAIIAVAPSSKICGSGNITLTSVNHLNGDTSDWYANGNYGSLLSSGSVHMEFGVNSTTVYNLVLTNEYGCTDTCSLVVYVNPIPVPPMITSSPTLCEGVPITLTVTNYLSGISWNTGSATTSITVTAAGSYTATYTDSVTGCSSSNNITINRKPPVGLFPHYCDNIPCSCRSNQQGDFTIYAPLPLIGAFAAIYNIQWYFNNSPVGPNAPNPTFTPAVTGTYHIVVTDPMTSCTDTSETYTIVVPLCNVCDSTNCHVDLGNDTTICAGGIVTLTANGCSGSVTWYELTQNGPVPIPGGQGPIVDVFPLQSTCYVVKCCDSIPDEINGGMIPCCCTDTICINVNPLPVLTWPVVYPTVCVNSDSIYLDTLSIIALPPGGTGVFSGIGVVGNYFHPDSIGTFTITYCYTDSNGCMSCVSNTIKVIFCCETSQCHVYLGNDTTICAGGVVILNAQGCNGNVKWYKLTLQGPVVIGQGPIIDVFPQVSTCYVVKCCCIFGTDTCCTSDTICVFVNPLPTLTWPVQYPDACLNSAPVYLDTLSIIALPPGGTGVFSGPGVSGNYFYPTTLGPHTITYCYTDLNGCTTCVNNTINVIFCCETSQCHVYLGNDTTICVGGIVILNAQGCNGNVKWYKLTPQGPVVIGQGPIIDVFPQVSTCYVVKCCCIFGTDTCCTSDTICVFVNPLPTLTWPVQYPNVCLNSAPVYLDTLSIIALPPGGTGVFSGPGVSGNYFYPTTLGPHTITYCYTDLNGCTTCVNNTINVIFCCDSSQCHVDIGNDTTICAGSVVILTAQGCNGSLTWYQLSPDGPVIIGQEPVLDVFPQQTTCYVAKCCCQFGAIQCCTYDTICITVNPHPILSWQAFYPTVCVNSDSIYLDTLSIIAIPPGGTGIFSGNGVVGNYFHPDSIGTFTITYCYTDTNGCTTCVSNTINVVVCGCVDTCLNFNDGNLIGWQADPSAPNVAVTVSNVLSQGGPFDYYIHAANQAGPSQLLAGGQFKGQWCCGKFCYDYRLFDDGETFPVNINPAFTILSGTLGFQFTSSTFVSENDSAWTTICAPVSDCGFNDTSSFGVWAPITGTNISDWFTVINNVTGVVFKIDYNLSSGEVSGFDNVCLKPGIPHVDAGPDQTVCEGFGGDIQIEACSVWQMLVITPSGNIPYFTGTSAQYGNGEGLASSYVVPTDTTTCFLIICCTEGTTCCCDTDTICIYVNPKPVIIWNPNFPNVCLNSAPVYLDTLLVNATPPGGVITFSGPFVAGNYFSPIAPGTWFISCCYTDTNGCNTCVVKSITVVPCCDSATCHIDAGRDTSICIGGVAILHAQGCDSIPHWYEFDPAGGITLIGNGPIIDVFPQQTTCYMVICCCPNTMCCDTDTVCVIVNPLPVLSWPTVYPTVCVNSDSIYLDPLSIIAVPPGGTGAFSGIGVVGNYFHPDSIGIFTILYCYTDKNGCNACVSNTINVIFCCDTNCHIDAGPDQTICLGQVAKITLHGCDSLAEWYEYYPENGVQLLFPSFFGNVIEVSPQQNTCYIVKCCNAGAFCCCVFDTVCVFVNPLPVLSWPVVYPNVCVNSDSVYLDTLNIISLPPGGTGVFSGIGVVGDYFHPDSIGSFTITYCYTDTNGCTTCVSKIINVTFCCDTSQCHVTLGNDTAICEGSIVVLNAQGCNGTVKWYKLNPDGPELINQQGPIMDVFPQQSTCYLVECCCIIGQDTCCTTDTICIIVKPHPILTWPVVYPTVCVNSDSIYLDTLSIIAVPPGGTGVFSGTGVVGNYFHPDSIGSFTITYCYTDPNGCNACVSNTINVIFCCDTSCHVDAGPDVNICIGQAAILTTTGCNGTTTWYALTPEGPIQVGVGNPFDVMPQQSTCYMAICCCQGPIACCDTDTICVIVHALPHIEWPGTFPDVCLNSDSIYLNPYNVFVDINQTLVMMPFAGGTWTFNGPGVTGDYFHPTTLGPHVITVCYTDIYGCMTCISKTINVIYCCGTSCQVNAGNDTTVCVGSSVVLNAQGCSGSLTWYQLGPEGPVLIGQENGIQVHPQQSTCYIAICCCVDPAYPLVLCCDTDTICINVKPVPHLDWTWQYGNVCLNSDSILLDANNVFVMINNTQVPITLTPGTWVWSGAGVVGNYFHPNSIGIHVITLCYTAPNGCTTCITNTINVIDCSCPGLCNCGSMPPPPLPTITINSVTGDNCFNDGCINVSFTGCCLMYNYTYYNPCNPLLSFSTAPDTNPNIFCNLPAGLYTIYVIDGCGNFAQQNVTIPFNGAPLNASYQFSSCADSVCVTATGGCAPYTYVWSNGATSSCITGLEHCTNMVVTITDRRGCTFTKVIWVPQVNFTNVVQPSCCNPIGSLCVNVCSGPHEYTYVWSNQQTGPCISGLGAGVYCVTITDETGNQIHCCYTLTDNFSPPHVSFIFNNCGNIVTAVIPQINCPYTYHWENNSTGLTRNNLTACDSITFTVITCHRIFNFGFRVPALFPTITPANCTTGLGMICVSVNCFRCPPYSYSWVPMPLNAYPNLQCLIAPPGNYNVCIFNSCGDVVCCQVYLPPPLIPCDIIININVLVEGFYNGNGTLLPVISIAGVGNDTSVCDTIIVELHEASMPYGLVESATGILHTDGTVEVHFPAILPNNDYYIVIKHRNSIEIWSKYPVTINAPVLYYDFTH